MRGERLAGESAMAALALRGAPRPAGFSLGRRRWGPVRDCLLRSAPGLAGVAGVLRAAGLWDEAWCLEQPGLLDWGLRQVESGRCLTVLSLGYPARWLSALGAAAPAAVWVRGAWPAAPSLAVAGSRALDGSGRAFAAGVGERAMGLGLSLVSGGAVGADSLAVGAALAAGGSGRVVEVLPFGLEHAPPRPGVCQVSACAPWAPFSAGQAMERNALVYASSAWAAVVSPRLRRGGSWNGAVAALRRRLCVVGVESRPGPSGPGAGGRAAASRALVALGAVPLACPEALAELVAAPEPVPSLFAVEEPRAQYRAGMRRGLAAGCDEPGAGVRARAA